MSGSTVGFLLRNSKSISGNVKLTLKTNIATPHHKVRAVSGASSDARTRSTGSKDFSSAVLLSSTGAKEFSEMPGPKPLPIVGNLFLVYNRMTEMPMVFQELTQVYGRIYKLKLPARAPMVMLSDVDSIEQLFKVEGKLPVRMKRSALNWYFENSTIPQGFVFTNDETTWRRLRSAANKEIVPRRLMQLTPKINKISDDFNSYIDAKRDSQTGNIADLMQVLNMWACEGVATVMIGEGLGMLSDNPSDMAKSFLSASLAFIRSLTNFLYAPPLYKIHHSLSQPYQIFDKAVKEVYSVGAAILTQKIKQIESGKNVEDVGFLGKWVLDGEMTDREILPIVSDFLAVGIDTTSVTTTFLLHELSKNPEIQERLRSEVISVFGNHDEVTDPMQAKLPYLKNCVKETLRLYPAGPIMRAMPEDVVLCGYKVPAGTLVSVQPYTLGRDPNNFSDPLTFNPDRWDKESKEHHHPFAYLPFGYGPRACYGRRLAEMEITSLLVKLMQNFRLSSEQKTLKIINKTTLQPAHPVQMKFEKL